MRGMEREVKQEPKREIVLRFFFAGKQLTAEEFEAELKRQGRFGK